VSEVKFAPPWAVAAPIHRGTTVSVPLANPLLALALIVTEVIALTLDVFTVKVALVEPTGI